MGTYTYSLSLLINHADADLAAIPDRLGMTPKTIWRKGDPRVLRNGRFIGGVRTDSYCSMQFGADLEKSLPDGLRAALAQLKPHSDLFAYLASSGAEVRFFIGWFSDGNSRDVLGADILKDLGELGIALDLDFYGTDEESSDVPEKPT